LSFSQDFIDKVVDANDLVEVISQDTQLKASGGGGGTQMMGVCPFPSHAEKTPSFSVSSSKQVYYCFGCQKSGNIITYLREMRGLSFPEAIEQLASKAGIPIPQDEMPRKEVDKAAAKKKEMVALNQIAKAAYHKSLMDLPRSHPVWQYLEKRGFSEEIIKEFELGYAPDDWEKLAGKLVSMSKSLDLAAQVGLVRKRNKGTGFYDLFRSRLLFPIVSHKDECVGFGGRVLSKEDQPKYLNSPDSDVFHKGRLFYGLNKAAKYIRSADKVVIVEGYTDLIALYQAGIRCVVATLGTALTAQHAKLLKRYTRNVYVLFDGDGAGRRAAERSLPILLSEGLFPKGLILPDKVDPDEFLKSQGADELKRLLGSSPDLFELILIENLKGFGGHASEKVQILEKLTPVLLSITDKRLLGLYLQSIAVRLNVTPEWAWKSIKSAKPKETRQPATARQNDEDNQGVRDLPERLIDLSKATKVEIELINVCLLNEKALQMVIDYEVGADMATQAGSEVLQLICERYGQMPSKFGTLAAYLQSRVEPRDLIAKHLKKPLSEMDFEGAKKLVNECVKRLKAARLRQNLREHANKLHDPSSKNSVEQLEQIMNIHKSRHSLNRETGSEE
jgi:DNA primase